MQENNSWKPPNREAWEERPDEMDWYPEGIVWQRTGATKAWTQLVHVDLLPIKSIWAFSRGICLEATCADITGQALSGRLRDVWFYVTLGCHSTKPEPGDDLVYKTDLAQEKFWGWEMLLLSRCSREHLSPFQTPFHITHTAAGTGEVIYQLQTPCPSKSMGKAFSRWNTSAQVGIQQHQGQMVKHKLNFGCSATGI